METSKTAETARSQISSFAKKHGQKPKFKFRQKTGPEVKMQVSTKVTSPTTPYFSIKFFPIYPTIMYNVSLVDLLAYFKI